MTAALNDYGVALYLASQVAPLTMAFGLAFACLLAVLAAELVAMTFSHVFLPYVTQRGMRK